MPERRELEREGAKTIYQLKRNDANKAQAELHSSLRRTPTIIAENLKAIKRLTASVDSLKRSAIGFEFDGFDQRLEALGKATSKSHSLSMASWFLMILFVCIELLPVVVKLLSPRGPYDDLSDKHEHAFEIYRIEQMSLLNQQANVKLEKLREKTSTPDSNPETNFQS
jgi:hypothetical protein